LETIDVVYSEARGSRTACRPLSRAASNSLTLAERTTVAAMSPITVVTVPHN
jgi:hypothetical protein